MNAKLDVASLHRDGVRLRLLEKRDLELTLSWRNRDDARRWFKHSATIEWDAHLAWYRLYASKPDDYTFVAEIADSGIVFGQSAIYCIDSQTSRAEIGRFLVAPEWAGRGLMKKVCASTLVIARRTFLLDEVYLEVFADNVRAIAVYGACGFERQSAADPLMLRMHRRLLDVRDEVEATAGRTP